MSKKIIIIAILIVLAGIGWRVWATSNPHTWTNGLVGYWSFDGQYTTSTDGTKDVSNNGNYGQFFSGVKPTAGISGQALSFDGVDDYVNVPYNSTLDSPSVTNEFTIEAWIYPNVVASNKAILERSDELRIYTQSANRFYIMTRFVGDAGGSAVNSITTYQANNWYHIVGIYDGAVLKIYINGVLDNSVVYNKTINSDTSTALRLGKSGIAEREFNGFIDEVRIYNRALSADEVKQHYDQTRRNVVINQPSGTPPVGWWKMDEGTGQTVRDYSVNANNGTMYWMSTSTNGGWTDGKIGKALSFDGVDDYVDVGTNNIFDFTTQDFSMFMWLKPAEDKNTYLLNRGGWRNKGWIFLTQTTGRLRFDTYQLGFNQTQYSVNNALSLGVWQYVGITRVGSSVRLWVNGVDVTGTPVSAVNPASNSNANLIMSASFSTRCINGSIDEVRIYNYARTADQIAADYRAGAYRTIVGTSVPSDWWTNGLVGYWSFDGQYTTTTSGANAGTRDVSNNGNWGTFYNGVKPVAGVVGQALSFDGVNDVVAPSVAFEPLPTINDSETFEVWIKPSSYGSNTMGIIGQAYRNAIHMQTNGNVQYGIRNTATGINQVSGGVASLNQWTFIVGTYDGTTLSIYINGAFITSTPRTITELRATTQLKIGADVGISGNFVTFNGLIDEVRIYNRALSADEVMQHYLQTRRNLKL